MEWPTFTFHTYILFYLWRRNYKKLINKYKNDGVIKVFRFESITDIENMDFKA
jgi:hypothetical protein